MIKRSIIGMVLLTVNIFIGLGLSLFVYALFIERPVLTYANIPFPVTKSPIRAGDTIPIRIDLCVRGDDPITYIITRSIRNVETKTYYAIDDSVVYMESGCRSITSLASRVPPDAVPGHYVLAAVSLVDRSIGFYRVPWRSQVFEVVK